MCINCHSSFSNNQILQQLNEIKDEHFPRFNQTSINHLQLASSGMNGPEVKDKAIEILLRFNDWKKIENQKIKNKKDIYIFCMFLIIGLAIIIKYY
jgi:hypothetical protein